jgi:hypothetical protein
VDLSTFAALNQRATAASQNITSAAPGGLAARAAVTPSTGNSSRAAGAPSLDVAVALTELSTTLALAGASGRGSGAGADASVSLTGSGVGGPLTGPGEGIPSAGLGLGSAGASLGLGIPGAGAGLASAGASLGLGSPGAVPGLGIPGAGFGLGIPGAGPGAGASGPAVGMSIAIPSGLQAGGSGANAPGLPSGIATSAAPPRGGLPVTIPGSADGYQGPGVSGSPNLLTQNGVGLYIQLLNSLAGNDAHEQSVSSLTNGLQNASATLRSAYDAAVSRLPPQLVSKDWGFSIADGKLIFVQHDDPLLPQDLTQLRNAFVSSSADIPAKQVAAAIISLMQTRNAGGDTGSLAMVRLDVDEANFGDSVDLRSYLTSTVPSGLYHPSAAQPARESQIPPMLGGMDLRDLVTARPRFLRADGSVSPEIVGDLEAPPAEAPHVSPLNGQCSCGQVRFVVHDEFEYAFYCHCSRCRVRTGSAFAAIAGIPVEKMEVIAGHEHLLLEGECSDGYGARCSRCFSFLFAAVRGRTYVHVALGVLADAPSRVPDHHVYVGSKAPWYQIADGLPQYEELP